MRQLVYNRSLHNGLWEFFVIRSVFEYEHASVCWHLPLPFTHLSPLAPRFNLIGLASMTTFSFRPLHKCPGSAEHCRASANCLPSLPPSDFEFRVPRAALCFAQAPSLRTSLHFHLLAPLLASAAAAAAIYCCCLLLLLPSAVAFCCCCLLLLSSTGCLCCFDNLQSPVILALLLLSSAPQPCLGSLSPSLSMRYITNKRKVY